MKILANIPFFIKLISGIGRFKRAKVDILTAKQAGDLEKEREIINRSCNEWSSEMKKKIGYTLEIEGQENIPDHGPVVIMANHQGDADILVMMNAFQKFQIGFVAKEELGKLPFFGDWITIIRSVFMTREDPRAALKAINDGVELIKQGFSLVIFPEGTRAQSSIPGPFMKGPIKLATKPGVPIIPVSIDGTYHIFEETGVIRPAHVKMIIHKPIETAGISRAEEKQLTEDVEKIIVDGVYKLSGLPRE